jgi:DNA processing protein
MSGLLFWQQLLTIDPYGKRFPDLIDRLEASSILDPSSFLLSHPLLSREDRERLARIEGKRADAAGGAGVRVLPSWSLGPSWREWGIPPAFFVRGQEIDLSLPRVGIVGTRTASTYGRAAARKFAEHLGRAGCLIVSGGAFGIDTEAHQGALQAGSRTLAVFGTGVDKPYPASNQGLFDRIVQQGALLSQFPLGTPSYQGNFVARNHTIAALCHAVVVVEAPEKSGALHTARAAAELSREVFVVPGPITYGAFRGSHALIRDGAPLADHPDQVLEALGLPPGVREPDVEPSGSPILEALKDGPLRLEPLAQAAAMDPSELLAELTMMELEGLIVRVPEGYALKA